MATKYWRGGAPAVTQVTTVTFSTYTSGQTYRLTINGKTVSFVATASTGTNVWAGLVAAWNATAQPEFQEIVASENSGIVLTANTAGIPFIVSASATTGSPTVTATTAATGPNHWDNAANWSGATLPSAADDIVIANTTFAIQYGLVDTNNYASVTIEETFRATIGLPEVNASGYVEYRTTHLTLGDNSGDFDLTVYGSGSQLIKIDAQSGTVDGKIYSTGTPQADEPPFTLIGTDSSSVMDYYSGTVSFGGSAATTRITPRADLQAPTIVGEVGSALGAILISGGILEIWGAATSVTASNGAQVYVRGAATCPIVSISTSAKVYWESTAGITTDLFVFPQGIITFEGNGGAKTVADASCYSAGEIHDPLGIVTWTDGVKLEGCTIQECTIDLGRDKKINTV